MSFGNGPKIYLRGAKPSILKYGGLGHRPLSFERLALTHVCHLLDFSLLKLFLDSFRTSMALVGSSQFDVSTQALSLS